MVATFWNYREIWSRKQIAFFYVQTVKGAAHDETWTGQDWTDNIWTGVIKQGMIEHAWSNVRDEQESFLTIQVP